MKKYFSTYLILSALCFSPFPVQAVCFSDLFKGKKQSPTLLEELADPELTVKSTIIAHTLISYVGDTPIPYILERWLSKPTDEQVKYSFTYIHPRRNRKEKGYVALSFRLSLAPDQSYQHWIFWPSDAKGAHMDEDTVRAVFDKVYEEVYGKDLDWMVENHVIPKTIFYLVKQEGLIGLSAVSYVDHFKLHDIFKFDSILFKTNKDRLKLLVAEVIQNPDQTQTDSTKSVPSRMRQEMENAIQEITLKEVMGKMMSLMAAHMRFSTPEAMKTLDMSSLYPKDVVKLLTEGGEARSWRAALTPEQIRQIDVSVPEIQYVFAPLFKRFRHVFSEALSIDTLSDEQIMSFDRDTFLRDVFLAGDLYVQGPMSRAWDVTRFMLAKQVKVKELGRDVVMSGSLSKEAYDFILGELGFHVDFKSMTPTQRREVFKSEIKMMTNLKQQMEIIEGLVAAVVLAINETLH